MTANQFIFSTAIRYRLLRHVVFWSFYIIFFYIQSIVPSDYAGFRGAATYINALKSVIHFIPCCILSVYIALYVIHPFLIAKRRIAASIVAILVLFVSVVYINYYFSRNFNKITTANIQSPVNFTIILGLGYLNSVWAITITGIALGIKIAKGWMIQQRDLLKIRMDRLRTETGIKKARVIPDFLVSTLKKLQYVIDEKHDKSAELVLMFSDVLNYILYETVKGPVELKRELFVLQQFIALENAGNARELYLELDAKSTFANQYISPLSLLSPIQQCLYSGWLTNRRTINVHIRINSSGDELVIRLFYPGDNQGNNLSIKALPYNEEELLRDFLAAFSESVRMRNLKNGIVIVIAVELLNSNGHNHNMVLTSAAENYALNYA